MALLKTSSPTQKNSTINHRGGEFKFEGTIVGTWAANALVKWISQIDIPVVGTSAPVNGKSAIASYDEFKSVALEVYDKLNYEYNFTLPLEWYCAGAPHLFVCEPPQPSNIDIMFRWHNFLLYNAAMNKLPDGQM